MTFLSSFLLGLVQGIAEFLPISSSGHLAIAQNLLGMSDAGTVPEFFDVLLHLGTLVAVFVAYWADIKDMVLEFFRGAGDLIHHSTPNPVPPARRLILLIILAWNYLKLLFEAAERYILLGVLVYTATVAFSMGGSQSTANIFKAWCRMLGGQVFLLLMNAWCLRLFTSMVGTFIANPLSL